MSNTVQIKRHSSNTNTSAPTSLADGELALNQADKKLYVGRHNNSSVEVFHLPTLEDITYGNGISGTIASGSNDNSSTLAVDVTDSNIFATTSAKGIASFSSDNFAVSSGAVTIKDGGVVTAEIAADAITAAKIADDAIGSEHIADDAVVAAAIADGAVNTARLAADAVTGAKLADDAVDSEHLADGSIDTAHIADNQVTTAKLAADAVTGAQIADDAINSEHYTDGSIDTAHIADNQVTAAKIEDNVALPGNCSTTGNFTVGGDLTVSGDTTTLNTATLTVEDKEVIIASGAADSAAADGAGIKVAGANATILYDHTGTQWEFNKPIEAQSGFVSTTFDGGTY